MPKHTAGPWTAKGDGNRFIHSKHQLIAEVQRQSRRGDPEDPSVEANARLMARAPEMLEVLRDTVTTLTLLLTHDQSPDGARAIRDLRQRAVGAISSAEGR